MSNMESFSKICSDIQKTLNEELIAAIKTLDFLGYTYHGGEQWKPPLETPQQRTWVGLTDDDLKKLKLLTFEKEINADGEEQEAVNLDQLIRAAEQLCKGKNNA